MCHSNNLQQSLFLIAIELLLISNKNTKKQFPYGELTDCEIWLTGAKGIQRGHTEIRIQGLGREKIKNC